MNYTKQQLQQAREYAAKIHWEMAAEVFTADYYAGHVDDEWKAQIKKDHEQHAKEIEQGLHDHNFTIAQRMHYYLTGECPVHCYLKYLRMDKPMIHYAIVYYPKGCEHGMLKSVPKETLEDIERQYTYPQFRLEGCPGYTNKDDYTLVLFDVNGYFKGI